MNWYRATISGGLRIHDMDFVQGSTRCGRTARRAAISGLPTNCPKCLGRRLLAEIAAREVTA